MMRHPQSLHKYLYVNGDPVSGIDPSGKYTLTEIAIVTAVVVAVAVVAYTAYRLFWKGFAQPLVQQLQSDPIDNADLNRAFPKFDQLATWSHNQKFMTLEQGLQSGIYQVRVYHAGNGGGTHNMIAKNQFFISDKAVIAGDMEMALAIFAEFQHDGDGGALNEVDAQTEFDLVRDLMPTTARTPYINRYKHGY